MIDIVICFFSSAFFLPILLIIHACVWRSFIQIHCLECWSPLMTGWYLWEAMLSSKSFLLQMQKWVLIQEWRYSKLNEFWLLCYVACLYVEMFECWDVCASEHLLNFIRCSNTFLKSIFLQLLVASKLFCYSGLTTALKY